MKEVSLRNKPNGGRCLQNAHEVEVTEVLQKLKTEMAQGLSDSEAARRFAENGPNELKDSGTKNPLMILWEQLSAAMVIILIMAAVLSGLLGDLKNAIAITAIVILNALLGFTQEFKAEKAMAALKKLTVPSVRVRRAGEIKTISSRELVTGDVVLLEAGNLVPADCRVLESFNLRIQESALTGESEPVEKNSDSIKGDIPIADKRNMAYMGTTVTYGRGQVAVLETGMKTELGRIAKLIQHAGQEPTPLQKRLDKLGKQLVVVALGIFGIVFVLGLFRGEDVRLMFMTAVSLAVAAVPEGMPAVVTIALALGAQRMLKRRALIRKLPAVETLGSVTVICSDKTGTLTENRMTVTVLDGAGSRLDLTEYFKENEACLKPNPKTASPLLKEETAFDLLLTAGALCNDASLAPPEETSEEVCAMGDPTETALVVAAARLGVWKSDLEKKFPRVGEIPFDSARKRMTTVHQLKEMALPYFAPFPQIAFTKGALDHLIGQCTRAWMKDHEEPLTEILRERIVQANNDLAKNGMRVLGVALHPLKCEAKKEDWESDLIFVGMIGMIDPARTEVKKAVETCKRAGIRPIMITGDHALTAQYIAHQLGISNGKILTGQDLEKLSVKELGQIVEEVSVYARVSPEHKLKIVEALQKRGHIVAMTGDGVNDAPALKKSDIGVAMGITGTDVSKEASDMVLLDDNFSTIVAAVEEGRVIYDNIRRFIKYLMTTNSSEICVMLVAPFLGMPLPLLPLQILWINLVTDGPVALALGVEPAEHHVMNRPPYPPSENLFSREMIRHMIWVGVLISSIALGIGYVYWRAANPAWQSMLFATISITQMGQALAIRSERSSLFQIGFFSNKALLIAIASTIVLQLAVIYIPFLQGIFKTVALSAQDLMVIFGFTGFIVLCIEIEKFFIRKSVSTNKPALQQAGE
jgi:P-type Ca2+ transporter type 2C